jgi:hypothetical protein
MTPLRGRVELTVFSPVLSMSRCHRALMVHASVDQPGVTERGRTSSPDRYRSEVWFILAAAASVCWNMWMSRAARSMSS